MARIERDGPILRIVDRNPTHRIVLQIVLLLICLSLPAIGLFAIFFGDDGGVQFIGVFMLILSSPWLWILYHALSLDIWMTCEVDPTARVVRFTYAGIWPSPPVTFPFDDIERAVVTDRMDHEDTLSLAGQAAILLKSGDGMACYFKTNVAFKPEHEKAQIQTAADVANAINEVLAASAKAPSAPT